MAVLLKSLKTLNPPKSATFSITQLSKSPVVYAALDHLGRPALLVEANDARSREVVRRGLRLQHRASCHVDLNGKEEQLNVSLVACESDDVSLQEAFISVGEIVLQRLKSATQADVVAILEELIELLERPGEPSREGAIGLFAELLVLSLANDPMVAVRAWRVGASDRFDLALGAARIEVKASGTRERRHRFSMEQCVPDPGTKAFVASTLVHETSNGTSVRELAERVQGLVKADAELVMKVQRTLFSIMGLPRSGEPTFDEAHARTKLSWYDVEDIPAIRSAPKHVDQVRYRIDLEVAGSLTVDEVISRAPCIEPCLPH